MRGSSFSPEIAAFLWTATQGRLCPDAEILSVFSDGSNGEIRADFWNPDSTRELMCGNALRCSAVLTEDSENQRSMSVYVGHHRHESMVISSSEVEWSCPRGCISLLQHIGGSHKQHIVDIGTLHLVEEVEDDLSSLSLDKFGFSHGKFPYNHTFVALGKEDESLFVRVFERGVGETKSCGSAAISAVTTVGARWYPQLLKSGEWLRVKFYSGEQLLVSIRDDVILVRGNYQILSSEKVNHILFGH